MMATRTLSQRQDLLDGIHTEGVLPYLAHHGGIDSALLADLGKTATTRQLNLAILRHAERGGKTGLALLVNALRQSWQLQLANSIDPDPRIQPAPISGYFGKDRHRGQLTIIIQVEALKLQAKPEKQKTTSTTTTKVTTTTEVTYQTAVPDIIIKSCLDNVDDTPLKDDTKDEAADEADVVKPRSCWCFCLFHKRQIKLRKDFDEKKEECKQEEKPTFGKKFSLFQKFHRNKLHVKHHKRKLKEKSKQVKIEIIESIFNEREDPTFKDAYSNRWFINSQSKIPGRCSSGDNKGEPDHVEESRGLSQVGVTFEGEKITDMKQGSASEIDRIHHVNSVQGLKESKRNNSEYFHSLLDQPYTEDETDLSIKSADKNPDKNIYDSLTTDYIHNPDLVIITGSNNNLTLPTSQSGNSNFAEQDFISEGKDFEEKAFQICQLIYRELHTEIIKYFEQDRGILVLDVNAKGTAVRVVCISMTQSSIISLQQDIKNGSLLKKIEDMFAGVNTRLLDVQELKLKLVVDNKDVDIALRELT